MHFYVDNVAEQVHIAFYVVGYPRPQFGWHNYNPDDKWLKPNMTKGFEVILTSRPSFGHYIIYGRATFSELSMNCFKGDYDFVVCNSFGCDTRAFHIPQGKRVVHRLFSSRTVRFVPGMPALMCPPPSPQLSSMPDLSADQATNFTGGSANGSSEGHPTIVTNRPYLSFPIPSTMSSYFGKEQENWVRSFGMLTLKMRQKHSLAAFRSTSPYRSLWSSPSC